MGSKSPTWADLWGSGNYGVEDDEDAKTSTQKGSGSGNKKMTEVKAAASAGFGKAKSAANVGVSKVKAGTSLPMQIFKATTDFRGTRMCSSCCKPYRKPSSPLCSSQTEGIIAIPGHSLSSSFLPVGGLSLSGTSGFQPFPQQPEWCKMIFHVQRKLFITMHNKSSFAARQKPQSK